jgi:hypothetical protein
MAVEGTLEITISNQTAPTGVDFRTLCTLLSANSLRECFTNAGATLFDSTHVTGFDVAYEGNHDRLSNFTNYTS